MDNKRMIRQFYENIVSAGLADEIGKYISADCAARDGETLIPIGLEGMRQHMIGVRQTYPDLRIRVTRQHADGEFVISEIITEGTQKERTLASGLGSNRRARGSYLPA